MTPRWMLDNSDASLPPCFTAVSEDADNAACMAALERHYGASRLRAMREYAHLARSPEVGWKAAVQAVRDGDPCLLLG